MEPVRILAEELEHARDLAEVTATLRTRLARTGLPPETTTAEVLAYLALGAFARRGDVPLLRPKLHVFVRGLEGAVVTFDGDPPEPRLWFSAGEALAAGDAERQATAVFPLSVCRTCGQHYLTTYLQGFALADGDVTGGEASGDSAYWLASPDPDAEGAARVRFTDWFLAEADPEDEEDGNGNGRRSKATARLDERRSEAWLCTQCGCVHRDEADSCSNPAVRAARPACADLPRARAEGIPLPGMRSDRTVGHGPRLRADQAASRLDRGRRPHPRPGDDQRRRHRRRAPPADLRRQPPGRRLSGRLDARPCSPLPAALPDARGARGARAERRWPGIRRRSSRRAAAPSACRSRPRACYCPRGI